MNAISSISEASNLISCRIMLLLLHLLSAILVDWNGTHLNKAAATTPQKSQKPPRNELQITYPKRINSQALAQQIAFPMFMDMRADDITYHHSVADESEFENPCYNFTAFGEEFTIQLTPDLDLVAPSYKAMFDNQTDDVDVEFIKTGVLRNCYYRGVLLGYPDSQVALSICNSLTGSIYTDHFHFFIEPMSKDVNENRHIVHRTRKTSSGKSNRGKSCGIDEERNEDRYRETFSKHYKVRIFQFFIFLVMAFLLYFEYIFFLITFLNI